MNGPDTALRGRLYFVQLGSPDPERLARFYEQVLGMAARQSGNAWICRGPDRCLVFTPGEAKTLQAAGYAAASPAVLSGLNSRMAANLVHPNAIEAELFQPGAIAFRDPDDNRIVYGLPAGLPPVPETDAPSARLQHVVLGSTDVARMVDFHTRLVGLRESDEVHDDDGGLRTCFMRSDDEHHSFAVFLTPHNRFDHHCYEVRDWNAIRDWGDRLAEHRVPVQWGPGRHGPGNNLFLFFHDPDGNWLELSAELEVVAADRPVGIWKHEERTLNSWGRGYLRS